MHGLNVGFAKGPALRPGDVTCVFSNPPFAGREEDLAQLSKFSTTMNKHGDPVETPKSIPFVEHILDLLAEGGLAALVLPNGIFNSQSEQFARLRDLIWTKAEVIAIIGLPHWVFFHTGCDVQGALLFLKRTDNPRPDYNIHIDWAEHVGYDAAGRKSEQNDFPAILRRYAKHEDANQYKASDLQSRGRMDPLYYQPGEHQRVSARDGKGVPLTELLVPSTEIIQRRRGNHARVRYVEVGDTDKYTGAIVSPHEYEVRNLPSRAKYIVRPNMLLIPNHRNSIKAGRSVVLVPPEGDGLVVTSRFIVAQSRVPAVYLYHILNLDIVKEKMLRLVSGSSSTEIKFQQLREIRIPMPESGDFDLFLENLHARRARVDELRNELARQEQELSEVFRGFYEA